MDMRFHAMDFYHLAWDFFRLALLPLLLLPMLLCTWPVPPVVNTDAPTSVIYGSTQTVYAFTVA